MAIPSGSGTEVAKRAFYNRTDANEVTILTGVANHIYTVMSVTICETAGNDETIGMYLDPSAAGTDYEIISIGTALPATTTYIFNDRLILSGTDQLHFKAGGTCDIDIVISYVDQDWT
jgi:hypothetical protein